MNKHTSITINLLIVACLYTPAVSAMQNTPVAPRVRHVQQQVTHHSPSFKERIKKNFIFCKQGIKKHARPIVAMIALALYTVIIYKLSRAPDVHHLEELDQQVEEYRDQIGRHESRLRGYHAFLSDMRTWLADMYHYRNTAYPDDTEMNNALLQTRDDVTTFLDRN